MTDKSAIIVKPSTAQAFETLWERGRVLFFSAPCGFGKTVLADTLLDGRPVLRLNAADTGFALPSLEDAWDILLIDNIQDMQEERDWQALCALIRESTDRRFVLLSRGIPPACLMAFQYAGMMTVLSAEDLLFDREDIRRLLQACGAEATDSEIGAILKETSGYPLCAAILARHMAAGQPYGAELTAQAYGEVCLYFETAVYRRFDLPIRRFLLELSPFECFDLELARMVSGDNNAAALLDTLWRSTTLLQSRDMRSYRFWPQFRQFLLWELDLKYTMEKQRALFIRGGLYYELKEDFSSALDCYTRGGDHAKVSELLIRNAELHPGMGHYAEMEQYYRALPEAEILASPSLMQGMSMLCALSADYDGSECWYGRLKQFVERCGKEDAAGRQARGRLAWLDISLPQRGVKRLTDTIPAVFQLLTNKELSLPSFSVTSALPSIMNGGKDFSPWSKKDDLLYRTMRIPAEAVLGRDGVGLADCAIAESKFEKGEDISPRMLPLVQRMNDIRREGTPDIELAANGLLARSLLASGQSEDARKTIADLHRQFEERELTRFLPNMDAMLCRIALHTGDLDEADVWYRVKAPREPMHINILKRYQYFTQAMVELANGKPDSALLTITPMEPYCTACMRYIDTIHLKVLTAIALYQKRDEAWRELLTVALALAEEYRFIRTVSVYGAAVLPLLDALEWSGNAKWHKRLMADVRAQAAIYPRFLQPRLSMREALTAAEMQVLRLICADKSNAEIGEILSIRVSTVKSHVSSVLSKLGVNRRSEARTAAKKLWLISEDQ